MAKINRNAFLKCVFNFFIYTYFIQSISLNASECQCNFCANEKIENEFDYSKLGDFEEMFLEFDRLSEENENESKEFFVKKWCKKAKRYFKKRLIKVVKKIINVKDFRNADDCAYTVAKFKRKIDRKVHNTGKIDEILVKFDEIADDERFVGMKAFSGRIKYYSENKKARPPKHPDYNRYNQDVDFIAKSGELDHIPDRALFGGVEIGCGLLIGVLPFPGCAWLAGIMIGHGWSLIFDGYMQEWEKQNKGFEIPAF